MQTDSWSHKYKLNVFSEFLEEIMTCPVQSFPEDGKIFDLYQV